VLVKIKHIIRFSNLIAMNQEDNAITIKPVWQTGVSRTHYKNKNNIVSKLHGYIKRNCIDRSAGTS
jgi:hypothetical protein